MKNTVLPLFLSGLIIFCAALFSWLYESEFIPHNIYYYSIIFVFIAISIEGRGNSLNAYIASYAPEEVRPQLISASQFSQNAVIFALSFLAGLLAHLYSPIWGVLSISAGGLLVSLVAILMMSVENLQES